MSLRLAAWATMAEAARIYVARADARTLLPGTLRAEETAYAFGAALAELRFRAPDVLSDSSKVTLFRQVYARCFGYDCCLRAALVVLTTLLFRTDLPPLLGADVDAAHALVLRAVALVPEVGETFNVSSAETLLADVFARIQKPALVDPTRSVLGVQFYDALCAAWRRPQVQAALRAHGTVAAISDGLGVPSGAKMEEYRARDVAAFGLRQCALPTCSAREVTVKQFKVCGGCKQAAYCCAEHGKALWREHKRTCTHAEKQAAQ